MIYNAHKRFHAGIYAYIYNMYVHSAVLRKTKLYGSLQLLDLKNSFTAMHEGKKVFLNPSFSLQQKKKRKKRNKNDEKQYETTMTAKKGLGTIFLIN